MKYLLLLIGLFICTSFYNVDTPIEVANVKIMFNPADSSFHSLIWVDGRMIQDPCLAMYYIGKQYKEGCVPKPYQDSIKFLPKSF